MECTILCYFRVGKDEANSHLVGLLDTLDPKKFYNRLLFEDNKGYNYVIWKSYL